MMFKNQGCRRKSIKLFAWEPCTSCKKFKSHFLLYMIEVNAVETALNKIKEIKFILRTDKSLYVINSVQDDS